MKLVYVCSDSYDPIPEVEWKAKLAVKNKSQVTILSTKSTQFRYFENDLIDGILVKRIGQKVGLFSPKGISGLIKQIKCLNQESPEICHVYGERALLPVIFLKNINNVVLDLENIRSISLFSRILFFLGRNKIKKVILSNTKLTKHFNKDNIIKINTVNVTWITWFDIGGIMTRYLNSLENSSSKLRGFKICNSPYFKDNLLHLYKDNDLFQTSYNNSDIILFNENYYNKKSLKDGDKKIAIYHHGTEYRKNQEYFSIEDKKADLVLVSTIDLLSFNERSLWLPSPVRVEGLNSSNLNNKVFKVGHLATSRKAANTEIIEKTLKELIKTGLKIEFEIIEGVSHEEALRRLASCNLLIDHMADISYRIAAVEAMAMGIPVIKKGYREKKELEIIGDLPFINVKNETELKKSITELMENRKLYNDYSQRGQRFVNKFHNIESARNRLNYVLSALADNIKIDQQELLRMEKFITSEDKIKDLYE